MSQTGPLLYLRYCRCQKKIPFKMWLQYFLFSLKYSRYIERETVFKGNEAADKAAKQACYHLNCPVPYSDIKHAIKLFIRNKWQREWHGYHGHKL